MKNINFLYSEHLSKILKCVFVHAFIKSTINKLPLFQGHTANKWKRGEWCSTLDFMLLHFTAYKLKRESRGCM